MDCILRLMITLRIKHLKSMIANLEAEQNYIMALFEGKCELRDNKK